MVQFSIQDDRDLEFTTVKGLLYHKPHQDHTIMDILNGSKQTAQEVSLEISFLFTPMGKGTSSFGRRNGKSHVLCTRCGKRSFHAQKSRCASCGYPDAKLRKYNYLYKALRRRTTGTGRSRHLKLVDRRAKNGFRSGLPVKA
ncbi:hypothetical protein GEMRC1_014018 [Eukaryota sp. GEM-RC1]